MQTAQRNSLRLLQWMMGASLALPMALFALASAVSWVSTNQTADREIERTLDVAHEHALKVFETIDRSLSEIAEIIRGIPDADISRREPALHLRLKELVGSLPQVKSAWVFDAKGHALVNSLVSPPPEIDFSDRDYFKAHVAGDIGTFIGDALTPRPPYQGAAFFGVSRRRPTEDGSFAGVIQASVLPEYFENFYARIGRDPGSFFALGLTDGMVLARLPALGRDLRLDRHGPVGQTDRRQSQGGTHHRDIAGRRDRTPARIPEACRLSGLCQRRTRDLGDPGALARHHGPAPDLRSARHRAIVSHSGAGAAADPEPVRRGGQAHGCRGGAEARATPRSARAAHRRRRP